MGDKNILIWLLLAAIFAGAAFWHVRENRRLARKWRGDFDADSAERLVHFAWARTMQLLYALACASAVIIVYSLQPSQPRQESNIASTPVATPQKPQQNAAIKPIVPPQNRVIPIQPKAAAPVIPHVVDSYYPPLVAQPAPVQSAPVQATPPVQTQPPAATSNVVPNKPASAVSPAADRKITAPITPESTEEAEAQQSAIGPIGSPYDTPATVDDVYNPEKKTGGDEAAMDAIKKRYEGIIVTYMYLKRCGKADAGDYPIIISALAQEMASVNAPGRMQHDIVTSAEGSYKEMYATSSCNDASVGTLQTQYAEYIKGLSKNIPSP